MKKHPIITILAIIAMCFAAAGFIAWLQEDRP